MSLPLVSRFAVSIDRVVLLRPSVIKPIRSIPGALAEAAAKIASTYSDVFTATILDAEKCRELKMGSYLAVAAASETNPPYFIHLCYKPPGGHVRRKLALVGKGITFDRFVIYYTFNTEYLIFGCSIHLCRLQRRLQHQGRTGRHHRAHEKGHGRRGGGVWRSRGFGTDQAAWSRGTWGIQLLVSTSTNQ
jgi:hypothetical protein